MFRECFVIFIFFKKNADEMQNQLAACTESSSNIKKRGEKNRQSFNCLRIGYGETFFSKF